MWVSALEYNFIPPHQNMITFLESMVNKYIRLMKLIYLSFRQENLELGPFFHTYYLWTSLKNIFWGEIGCFQYNLKKSCITNTFVDLTQLPKMIQLALLPCTYSIEKFYIELYKQMCGSTINSGWVWICLWMFNYINQVSPVTTNVIKFCY